MIHIWVQSERSAIWSLLFKEIMLAPSQALVLLVANTEIQADTVSFTQKRLVDVFDTDESQTLRLYLSGSENLR